MKRIVLILFFVSLAARAGHDPDAKTPEGEPSIELGTPPDWSDFSGGGPGEPTTSVRVGRGSEEKKTREKETPSPGEESKRPEAVPTEPVAPVETKPYRTYLNYDGREGWLTSQVDQSGKAREAKFNPSYDPTGKKGESVGVLFTGPNGTVPFNRTLQGAVALGKLQGSLNGKSVAQSNRAPAPGAPGGGCCDALPGGAPSPQLH